MVFALHLFPLLLPLAAAAGDVFVSPAGDDGNSGGSAKQPVATLDRARALAAAAPRPTTVHVGAGAYYLGNRSLTLGSADGGGVTWQGAPDGSAVIYAGSRIRGWSEWRGGVYRAPWTGPRFYAMTEGRRPAAIARHPDPGSGYLALTRKDSYRVGWSNGTEPGSLRGRFTCAEAGQCQAYLQCNYFSEIHSVKLGSIDFDSNTLEYEAAPHCSMSMGMGGVYLQGALEFLSAPGEFALVGGFVYYRPYGAGIPIAQLTIVASIPQRAIEFVAASSAAPVTGIALKDLTLIGSGSNYSWQIAWDHGPTSADGEGYQSNYIMTAMQQGQLYFENASGITVSGCECLAAGQSAIWMQGFAQNISITGNVIRETGFTAIYMSGYCRASSEEDRRRLLADEGWHLLADGGQPTASQQRAQLREAYHSRECVYTSFANPEETFVSKGNTISHNFMSRGNLAIGGYAGIMLYESGENVIVHNVIKGYARDAIGLFGSQPAMGSVQDNVLVNFESSNRFTQTKSNYVAWNDISLTNQDSDDTGEIEMYGTGSDNIMEFNALHDIYDSSTGMHSVLFSDDWSPNTTWRSNLVGPFVRLAGGGDCDFFMVKSFSMVVDGNIFADSSAHDGGTLSAYEYPVSNMSFTRNIMFNTTRLQPKRGQTPTNISADIQHMFPLYVVAYNKTTEQFYKMEQPGCPETESAPCPWSVAVHNKCPCSWSFPLGKGGFDLPQSVRDTLTVTEIDFNYYAGLDPSVFELVDNGYGGDSSKYGGGSLHLDAYDRHGVRNATATEADAAALFHRPRPKLHHELSTADYTVRADSDPVTKLGFVPWNTSNIGVDSAFSRFTEDQALSYAGWAVRIQGESQDRMEGVHPRGMLGGSGGVRSIGSAPAAGGSPGATLSVAPGAWARYEQLDFGAAGSALATVSARVTGAGTLVFTLCNLEDIGTPAGVRIATLSFNANNAWTVVRSQNVTARANSLTGVQTVYVQWFPARGMPPSGPQPQASQCSEAHCAYEGQTCPAGRPDSISIGYICCGIHSTGTQGNWCPDSSITCGPTPRRPGAGKPLHDFGAACANGTVGPPAMQPMALDYWVFERASASGTKARALA
jgi:hypothetical protein